MLHLSARSARSCSVMKGTTASDQAKLKTGARRARARMVPREVLAPSSLPLQGSACAVSAIEAKLVRSARVARARPVGRGFSARPRLLGTPRAHDADPRTCTEMRLGLSQPGLLIPFRSAKWCQAPDSHREAVRFELTRYADSRQLGGTRGQIRTDSWRLRRSPSLSSARVWRPELDSNQHRRLRRPSTGFRRPGQIGAGDGTRTRDAFVGNEVQ